MNQNYHTSMDMQCGSVYDVKLVFKKLALNIRL
jgi:hypothetical protein